WGGAGKGGPPQAGRRGGAAAPGRAEPLVLETSEDGIRPGPGGTRQSAGREPLVLETSEDNTRPGLGSTRHPAHRGPFVPETSEDSARSYRRGTQPSTGHEPFVLETSEDNTLVNRAAILEYLSRRRHHGLDRYFVFNPGQNTIWDLTDKRGAADEEYIDRLVAGNPFAVALGADGPS